MYKTPHYGVWQRFDNLVFYLKRIRSESRISSDFCNIVLNSYTQDEIDNLDYGE